MAPSGRVIEVGGVDWHRLGDGDSEAGRQAAVLDLLRRAQRELGGGPLTGTRFLYRARDMLAATREIEAAVRGADTTLFVGFQRAGKLDGEAATYRGLVAAGVRVIAFGTGEPGPLPGVDWVRLPEDQAALQNQWLLVAEAPEPIAFVGFETSEPDRFGQVGVTDPSRSFIGFVTGDRQIGAGHRGASGGHRPRGGPGASSLGPRKTRDETVDVASSESEGRKQVEQGASSNLGARLAAGEEGAINECYSALGPMVLGYLRRFVSRDEAEDVLQRVFYEVWRNRDRYDPTRSLEAWVLGIARKRAIDQLRRRHANVVPIEELRDIAGDDGRELAERYARANEVRGALERLPREQREVLALAYFGDLTQTEIAERLGVPLGTVKARTFRGLRRLADIIGTVG